MHVPCNSGTYCISTDVYFNDDEPNIFHLQASWFKFHLDFFRKVCKIATQSPKEMALLQNLMSSHTKC